MTELSIGIDPRGWKAAAATARGIADVTKAVLGSMGAQLSLGHGCLHSPDCILMESSSRCEKEAAGGRSCQLMGQEVERRCQEAEDREGLHLSKP